MIGACLITAACATAPCEPVVKTVTVSQPVPVKCAVQLSTAPSYPDTDAALKAAPDLFARVQLLVGGRLERIAREAELSAALKGCTGD